MGTAFDKSTQRYQEALERGESIDDAITAASLTQHRRAVYDAAVVMLEADGEIDMKELAARAKISRASLYRYYPDKLAVEAEIAASLVRKMTAAAAEHDDLVDRADAAIGALLDFPAGAAALGPVVAAADLGVISASVEAVVGHPAVTPVLIGFASIVAPASRRGDMDAVIDMRDTVMNQFRQSFS
ncbi:MAG: TetR family transcriptional regulator [Actinomycetota bacterium]